MNDELILSKKNILKDKSYLFAIRVIKLYKYLTEDKKEYVLSKQLLRSGTSIGALIREAQNAESKKDFIHKLAISQKECDESLYWIELLKDTDYLTLNEYESIYKNALELLKMIRSASMTSKKSI
ncbi:MAG: four helix bundle protein [Flavobacteriales bacterium]|nr:four helix bundle protein [Flavobacteriales bacterium]